MSSEYDSILFGNGLTKGILNDILAKCKDLLDEEGQLACNQNEYISYLLRCPLDCPAYKGLLSICTFDSSTKNEVARIISAHEKAKAGFSSIDNLTWQTNVEYIRKNGFEAWGGLHCFDSESSFFKKKQGTSLFDK